MSADNVLVIDQVTKAHRSGGVPVTALAGVSVTVHPGEMVAVMGPSGSGKSTLLNLAAGIDSPDSGTVTIEGAVLGGLDAAARAAVRRRQVGLVFQDYNLIRSLTAAENAALPLELDGASARAARVQALEALERVGIGELAPRFPAELSGGQQQRVAIARAVIGQRRLILADEPTGALDSVTGDQIMGLFREQCARGAGVLLVTHDHRQAGWADRTIMMRDGVVAAETAADDPRRWLAEA